MVHSKKFHAGDLDWEATVEHDTDLQAARVIVVGVTPRSISQQPERTVKRIEDGIPRGSRQRSARRGHRHAARPVALRAGEPAAHRALGVVRRQPPRDQLRDDAPVRTKRAQATLTL
jgi:hypothetical protein